MRAVMTSIKHASKGTETAFVTSIHFCYEYQRCLVWGKGIAQHVNLYLSQNKTKLLKKTL